MTTPLPHLRTFLTGLACLAAASQCFAQNTYWVATNGKDTFAGTQTKPWKTLQYAADHVAPGDTVLVRTGKYIGRVNFHTSGTSAKPITFANAPGEAPIIDGTGLVALEDNDGLLHIQNVDYLTIQGFQIRNFKTTNSNACPIGIFIEGRGDHLAIRNNVVYSIENTGSDPDSINALGIAVYGNSPTGPITNLVIDGNEVRNTKTGSSETVTVNGNVDGFEVTNNSIHNTNNIGIDCIGYERTSPIASQDFARNGLVSNNLVYSVTSLSNPAYFGDQAADGIYVDGGADIVIERNIVHHTDIGIEVASEHRNKYSTRIIVRNNLVHSNYVVGMSLGGYKRTAGGTTNCTFVNNTLYQNDLSNTGSGEFQIQFNTTNNLFTNNILFARKPSQLITSYPNSAIGVVCDYNLYYTPRTPEWVWDRKTYISLAAFSTATGNDTHSIFASPQFADAANLDLRLLATSPAIGRGSNLGPAVVGTLDLGGLARVQGGGIDLGCYER